MNVLTEIVSTYRAQLKGKTKYEDSPEISPPILREFKGINELLFPLKSPENLWFSDDFSVKQINLLLSELWR